MPSLQPILQAYTLDCVPVSQVFKALHPADHGAALAQEFFADCKFTTGDVRHSIVNLDDFEKELEKADGYNVITWLKVKIRIIELKVTLIDLST